MDPKSKNGFLRLDILEYYINVNSGNKVDARYKKTKEIYSSLERKKQLPKIEHARKEIFNLKKDISAKKIHYCVVTIMKNLSKARKMILKNEDEKSFNDEVLSVLAHQKTVKLAEKIFNLKKDKDNAEFLPEWIIEAFKNKNDQYNSSKFYRDSSEKDRKIMSKLYNYKAVVENINICNDSLKLICGPVERKEKSPNSNASKPTAEDEQMAEEDDNDSEILDSSIDKSRENGIVSDGRTKDYDVADDEDDYSIYDNMVMASDVSDASDIELDINANYNEVTDEEPSAQEEEQGVIYKSDDDFFDFDAPKRDDDKKKKNDKAKERNDDNKTTAKLPALQQGYVSGGESESDLEKEEANDDILKNLKKVKKNRRGQRARQKIWEQKYGHNANHVKKETERMKSERERKQLEYEERVRKRAEKARLSEEKFKNDSGNANNTPLGKRTFNTNEKEKPMHPSWIAKRQAEKQLAKTTFAGKKVKFD